MSYGAAELAMVTPSQIRARKPSHFGVFGPFLALVDMMVVAASGLVAGALIQWLRPHTDLWPMVDSYHAPILLGAVLTPSLLNWFGLYRSWRGQSSVQELRKMLLGIAMVAFVLAVLALATKTGGNFSRTWMVAWLAIATIGLCCSRVVLRSLLRMLRSRGLDARTVALVGGGELGQRVIEHVRAHPSSGFNIVGYFAGVDEEQVAGLPPCLGRVDEVHSIIETRRVPIDQIWIVLPFSAEQSIRELLHRLRHSTVDIRLIPDVFSYQLLNYSTEQVVGLPILNLSCSPLSGANRYAKELLDRLLGLYILIAISPLMLLIALGVKLTSAGPVFFRQVRQGWDGRPFMVYKFRTMHAHASLEQQFQQARRDDPRVTAFGQFLRRTSLDELPQFINVLEGTMSIVGPRPHVLEQNDRFRDQVERYMWRHKVKPGITGWAQVNGYRGETDTLDKMRKRVEYDLYYIEHWSLWFDIRIILMTLWRGFTDRNAY